MYIPKFFEINDQEEIFSFIENNAFGQLTSRVDGRLFSTHLPFLLSQDRKTLIAHVAKQNPQHLDIESQEVLITLSGPHGYISPSWYGTAGVPTWNYQAVHLYGRCTVFNEPEKLHSVVSALTEKHESHQENPWQPDYKPAMLSAIVGIEISIDEIQCKYKLSQNRPVDVERVAKELVSNGSEPLAKEIRRVNML